MDMQDNETFAPTGAIVTVASLNESSHNISGGSVATSFGGGCSRVQPMLNIRAPKTLVEIEEAECKCYFMLLEHQMQAVAANDLVKADALQNIINKKYYVIKSRASRNSGYGSNHSNNHNHNNSGGCGGGASCRRSSSSTVTASNASSAAMFAAAMGSSSSAADSGLGGLFGKMDQPDENVESQQFTPDFSQADSENDNDNESSLQDNYSDNNINSNATANNNNNNSNNGAVAVQPQSLLFSNLNEDSYNENGVSGMSSGFHLGEHDSAIDHAHFNNAKELVQYNNIRHLICEGNNVQRDELVVLFQSDGGACKMQCAHVPHYHFIVSVGQSVKNFNYLFRRQKGQRNVGYIKSKQIKNPTQLASCIKFYGLHGV